MKIKLIITLSIFLLILGIGGVSASEDITYDKTTIDENTPFNNGENIKEYEDNGVTVAYGNTPDIRYTVSKDSGDIDSYSAGFFEEMGNKWIEIDYNEERPINLRFHVDEAYITPYTVSEKDTADDKTTVQKQMVNKGQSMSVSVKLPESGSYVIALDTSQAQSSWATGILSERVPMFENEDVLSQEEWQYVSDDAFALDTDATYPIQTENPDEVLVEYESDGDEWKTIPSSTSTSEPYYQMERSGSNNIYIVNTDIDTQTDIRYKKEGSTRDSIREISTGFRDITSNLLDDIRMLSNI